MELAEFFQGVSGCTRVVRAQFSALAAESMPPRVPFAVGNAPQMPQASTHPHCTHRVSQLACAHVKLRGGPVKAYAAQARWLLCSNSTEPAAT
eukprot:3087217-Pleurochrysis_carterae.AAC.1